MTYKEFYRWCQDRAHDGCWSLMTALVCMEIIEQMKAIPFWRRKKKWNEIEHRVVTEIVNPTNEHIRRMTDIPVSCDGYKITSVIMDELSK